MTYINFLKTSCENYQQEVKNELFIYYFLYKHPNSFPTHDMIFARVCTRRGLERIGPKTIAPNFKVLGRREVRLSF